MILYGSGLGDGDLHSHHDLPVLVAGGGARPAAREADT